MVVVVVVVVGGWWWVVVVFGETKDQQGLINKVISVKIRSNEITCNQLTDEIR